MTTIPEALSLLSNAVHIGEVFAGHKLLKTFSIANVGTSNAVVASVTVDNPNYSIVEQPTTIAPGDFGRLTIELKSSQPGTYSSRVAIQYQTGSYTFDVTGRGQGCKYPYLQCSDSQR